MWRFGGMLFVVLMLASPAPVLALKADYHEALTVLAISNYQQCQRFYPAQLKTITDSNASVIAVASGDIDRLSVWHLRRSLSRLWNWHFYDAALSDENNPHIAVKRNWLHMNRSLHRIFVEKAILASQRSRIADQQFFELSGEVLHFVQDMGVPAHVVPIYHDKLKRDDFDFYVFSGLSTFESSVKNVKEQCETLINRRRTPEQLLNDLAQNTRLAITENIAGDTGKPWTLFWIVPSQAEPASKDGFYDYGFCGNVFDSTKHQMQRLPQVCQIKAATIRKFYAARYKKMLDASLAVLIYLNRK